MIGCDESGALVPSEVSVVAEGRHHHGPLKWK